MKTQNQIIKDNNLKLKKSLGQNFLKDNNIINKIVTTADVSKDDIVIEIGPGAGALTEKLVERAGKLTAIEIDNSLVPYLQEKFSSFENFEIINEDFLKVDPKQINQMIIDNKNVKVVANLPYYITSAIISKILLEYPKVDELYIMVQKEVAERICSEPKRKSYGSLSVFCQSICDVKYEFTVSKNVFIPAPKIDSAIISLKRKDNEIEVDKFQKFVKNCFKQKRKTLINNLSSAYQIDKTTLSEFLVENNHDPRIRAEYIDIESFYELFSNFKKLIKE